MKKFKYESPKILNLGEMAEGIGQCNAGIGNNTSSCNPGYFADSACANGTSNHASSCTNGSTASISGDNCDTGSGNDNATVCSSGTTPTG